MIKKGITFQFFLCVSYICALLTDIIINMYRALELLAAYEWWTWVNDTFIIELLWPRLKVYVGSPENSDIPHQFIEFILKVLGKYNLF